MAQFVNLNPGSLRELHVGNERLVSYNVEMTEVTGGTFWKAYTPAQIAGTEPFVLKGGFLGNATASTDLMQYYDPIDLSDKKLRKLAKEIGPAWVRVSGTWSTKTYYDFDGHTNGVIPEGYNAILTREQWLGVLDFCKDIGAKLLISVADCEGLHHAAASTARPSTRLSSSTSPTCWPCPAAPRATLPSSMSAIRTSLSAGCMRITPTVPLSAPAPPKVC